MPNDLQLDSLLQALRTAGLRVGISETLRLRQVFASQPVLPGGELSPERLRSLLRAVLVKSVEDRATFDRVCDAWLNRAKENLERREEEPILSSSPPPPPEPRRAPRARFFRQASMASVLALLLVTVATDTRVREGLTTEPLTAKTPPVPPQPQTNVTDITPDEVRKRTFRTMVATLDVTPHPWRFLLRPEMGLAVFAWLGAGGLWLALRRRRLLPEPEPLAPADGPARAFPLPVEPAGTVLLAPREQEGLAWGIGRFVSEEPTRRLDLAATVRATALAGGFPSMQFHRARFYREVWLWVDETADDPALPRLAGEIEAVLAAHGLPVERASFRGIPDRLVTDAGQVFAPNEIDERRDVALVAILTDGRLLVRRWAVDGQRGHIDALLRSLSHWPRLAFVDASRDRDGLAPILGRHSLSVIAPEATAAFLGGSALPKEMQALRGAEQDSEIAWAAACALCPAPVDEATALELRRQLALPASPYALQALRAEAPGPPGRLAWRTPDRIRRVSWLREAEAHSGGTIAPQSLLDRALGFWEGVYDRSLEKATGLTERALQMERALLGLWRGPRPYVAELYQLFQGPLREVIRQHCGTLAPAGWGDPGLIQLPWPWSEPTPVEREMLREMGLGGGMPRAGLRRPGRTWLGIGLLAGLGLAAAGLAAYRAGTSIQIKYEGSPPADTVTESFPIEAGTWSVTISTRQRDFSREVEAGNHVLVRWQPQQRPCVETGPKGVEIWFCGSSAASAPRLPAAFRSIVFLDRRLSKEQGEIERLALNLLDSGSADVVAIGRDPNGIFSSSVKGQQTLILASSALPDTWIPPSITDDPLFKSRGARLDVERLAGEDVLRFEGLRPVREIFPGSPIAWGDHPSEVVLRGLGAGCRHTQVEENGFTFVRICPGTFTMGSKTGEPTAETNEMPAHKVTLDEFWMSRFEVTNEQFRRFHSDHTGAPDLPVVEVTWTEARDFCEKLAYRLPTEAEWEYAARAGTKTPWSSGSDEKDLERFAWFDQNSGGELHPVGQKDPNPWGLYDMHGNVWEWVEDGYGYYSARQQVNPTGSPDGTRRVLRGGGYLSQHSSIVSSAHRSGSDPDYPQNDVGFRCVRDPRR